MNEEVNKILAEMAEETDLSSVQPGPGMTVPVTSKKPDKQVEMIPGIMVSQKLIDEAVRLTSSQPESVIDFTEKMREADRERIKRAQEELKQDITASREIVFAMLQRMRDPIKYEEKFVSYDTMPSPLQRVIKAYIEAEAANRELNEAVAALSKDLKPPVAKPE
jgi:hypothetical protein